MRPPFLRLVVIILLPSSQARTWPINGTFSAPQRELYQAVLNTLKEVSLLATESSCQTLHSLHHESCKLLHRELKQIGFNIGMRDVDRLYPHFLSHPVGLGEMSDI